MVWKHFIVHQGYVQKRWPAKTFLVGGDTEPQIDHCFLNTFFSLQFRVLLPLSTCYFHFKKKKKGPGTCGRVRVKTNSSLIPLHYFQVDLITDAEWPQQMETASDQRSTSQKWLESSQLHWLATRPLGFENKTWQNMDQNVLSIKLKSF